MALDHHASIKRGLTIVLAMVITFCVLESLARCWAFLMHAPQSHSSALDVKIALAAQPAAPGQRRVLLLGDSKLWHGIFPELLQVRLATQGHPAMVTNHGVNGATPRINQMMYAHALAQGVKPDVVVFNVSTMMVNKTYFTSDKATSQHAFDASYTGRCMAPKLLHQRRSWAQSLRCRLESFSVLLQQRANLAEQIKSLALSGFWPKRDVLAWRSGATQLEGSMQGWSPDSEVMVDMERDMDLPAWVDAVKHGESLTPFVEDWHELQAFIAYCQAQRIPLVLLWLPEHPSMRQVYQTLGAPTDEHMASVFTRLASVSRPDAPVWFLNLQATDAESTHYYNPDHQNVLGAIPATERLAQFIRQSVWPTLTAGPPNIEVAR